MGLIRADRPLLIDGWAEARSDGPDSGPADGGYEFRREPSASARARDPYEVWLARREAERELAEPTTVRWVYRRPRVTRPAADAPVARIDVQPQRHEATGGEEGFTALA